MSSLTTKVNPVAALQNRDAYSAIEAMKGQLMAALPTHLAQNRDRYARILVTTLRRTPKLMQCDPLSLLGSIMQSAQLGLEPGTGQVHLVPFKNQVQMIIGYEGLIELARRAGVVIHPPRIVREGDTFDVDFGNIKNPVVHKPAMNDAPMTHVWCAAVIKDMDPIVEVMSKAQCLAVMRSTQSKGKYGPWKDHFESMCGKTCIRRLAKYLPKNAEMLIAEKVDGHTLAIEDVMSEPVVEWDGTVEEATDE